MKKLFTEMYLKLLFLCNESIKRTTKYKTNMERQFTSDFLTLEVLIPFLDLENNTITKEIQAEKPYARRTR